MKALPMLDHVMLWVARVLTILLFVWSCLLLVNSFTPQYGPFRNSTSIDLFSCLLSALWIFCLWKIHSRVARFFLGISSACLLAKALINLVGIVWDLAQATDGTHDGVVYWAGLFMSMLIFTSIPLLGLISLIWVSVRPQQKSTGTSRPIAPSSHNPVNLVNPI
jgi:hypothetical protein